MCWWIPTFPVHVPVLSRPRYFDYDLGGRRLDDVMGSLEDVAILRYGQTIGEIAPEEHENPLHELDRASCPTQPRS